MTDIWEILFWSGWSYTHFCRYTRLPPTNYKLHLLSRKTEYWTHAHTLVHTQIDVTVKGVGRGICLRLFFSSYLITKKIGFWIYPRRGTTTTKKSCLLYICNFSELTWPYKWSSFRLSMALPIVVTKVLGNPNLLISGRNASFYASIPQISFLV